MPPAKPPRASPVSAPSKPPSADARTGQQVPTGGTALEVRLAALRLDLQNIARTARSIALEQPGFADAFRLPDPPTDGGLLTTAEAYIARLAARPDDDTATKAAKAAMTAAFLAHELPADFITHLQADVQAIRDEYALREKNREKGVRSTGTVGPLLKEANDIITMLNAVMHNKYTRVPDKLRAWKSASHVERAAQREKKPEPPTPTPPAA
jgi:hypothetical protein